MSLQPCRSLDPSIVAVQQHVVRHHNLCCTPCKQRQQQQQQRRQRRVFCIAKYKCSSSSSSGSRGCCSWRGRGCCCATTLSANPATSSLSLSFSFSSNFNCNSTSPATGSHCVVPAPLAINCSILWQRRKLRLLRLQHFWFVLAARLEVEVEVMLPYLMCHFCSPLRLLRLYAHCESLQFFSYCTLCCLFGFLFWSTVFCLLARSLPKLCGNREKPFTTLSK